MAINREYVPDWQTKNLDVADNTLYLQYMQRKQRAGSLNHRVVGYAHGATVVAECYGGATLAPDGKTYLIPRSQGTTAVWHYIDTNGTIVPYTHGITGLTRYAYWGGVLNKSGRIYFAPFDQGTAANWHYIDTSKSPGAAGHVVAYSRPASAIRLAYLGAVLQPNTGRVYFVPAAQGTVSTWHYIDADGTVVTYTHGASVVGSYTYTGGVLQPNTGRIYLSPRAQATAAVWHYIDTDGSVVAYTHGSTCVVEAYNGAVLQPNTGRIYLAPQEQATAAVWHYIDTDGTVVAYTHGSTCVASAYWGGALAPNGRIYLIPSTQATATVWHYIDIDGSVVAYTHGSSQTVNTIGGVLVPNGRIYIVPRDTSATWHYINTQSTENYSTKVATSPFLNKY
jgi:hypothetical protein